MNGIFIIFYCVVMTTSMTIFFRYTILAEYNVSVFRMNFGTVRIEIVKNKLYERGEQTNAKYFKN